MANKRASKRIPFRVRASYGLDSPEFSGYTLNISENGIRIESNKALPKNSRVIVYIYTGEGGVELEDSKMDQTLVLEGVVAWVSPTLRGVPSKMGIKILTPNDDFKSLYQRKLNRYNSDIEK